MIYLLAGLSFREFLVFTKGISFEAIRIDDINNIHQNLGRMIATIPMIESIENWLSLA